MLRQAMLLALVCASPLAAQQVFRSGVELVHLPVVVSAKDGQAVPALEPSDFEIYEDGKLQKISFFAQGATREAVTMHLGLMLDKSESMERDIRAAATAAIRFVNKFDEAVDVTFVDFDTKISVGRFTPPSYPQLFERIRDKKAGGMTSLYDALGMYLETALSRDGQHVLLLYTDGGDSTSSMTFGRLTELLRLANVVIYTIGYLENQTSTQRVSQQMRMSQIARETGGEAFFPASATDVDGIYDKILSEIGSRYTIGYSPASGASDGKFRKVEVKLKRTDLKNVKVRTRSGYIRK